MRPTENQIEEVLNICREQEDKGGSKFPGMTYEQGVLAVLTWMEDDGENPIED